MSAPTDKVTTDATAAVKIEPTKPAMLFTATAATSAVTTTSNAATAIAASASKAAEEAAVNSASIILKEMLDFFESHANYLAIRTSDDQFLLDAKKRFETQHDPMKHFCFNSFVMGEGVHKGMPPTPPAPDNGAVKWYECRKAKHVYATVAGKIQVEKWSTEYYAIKVSDASKRPVEVYQCIGDPEIGYQWFLQRNTVLHAFLADKYLTLQPMGSYNDTESFNDLFLSHLLNRNKSRPSIQKW